MSNNNITTHKIEKGDVIWVPYRSDPMWPALVQNVYPKKVTYCFFPLPSEKDMKKNRFSCSPKLTYALIPTEPLPESADERLIVAFNAASSYLNSMGIARGSEIESIGEAEEREQANGETQLVEKRLGKRKKSGMKSLGNYGDYKEEVEEEKDLEMPQPALKKLASSSSSDRPVPSEIQKPITAEQSKEMMDLIDIRLKSLFDVLWKSASVEELRRNGMGQEATIRMVNNQFLSVSDYESLFERLITMVRAQTPPISLFKACIITATSLMPNILIKCYSELKNVDLETANEAFYQSNTGVLGLDPAMRIPVTDHLEQLCLLACNESDAIQK